MKIKRTNGLVKPLVAATAFGVVGATLAITEAGTVIKNLATVTYTDSNGDSYTATSNEAQVTVADVFTATLDSDNTGGEAAPGQTIYFPHVLTNTGNGPDSYTLAVTDDGSTTTVTAADVTIYLDENGNGQPDAGEPVITSISELPAGEAANIIVAVNVPVTADGGDVVQVILTATGSGTVEDTTPSQGIDGNDNTNQDRATVTLEGVLVTTKSSNFDIVNNEIDYTLTVKNVGGSSVFDVDIFDVIPTDTTFVASSISVAGLLTANSDGFMDDADDDGDISDSVNANASVLNTDLSVAITLTDDFGEPTGIDLNGNGTPSETNLDGFVLRDAELPPNTTVSVTYTVSVAANAGDVYKNRFCAGDDINLRADNTTAGTAFVLSEDIADCSNQTIDEVPFTFGVTADDNDNATAPNEDDDVTYVAEAPVGGTVDFVHSVTNDGTQADIINVEAAENTFPTGTVFTFWEANGFVPLTDNDGDGKPDVGQLDPSEEIEFVVRAILPATVTTGVVGAVTFGDNALQFTDADDAVVEDASGDYYIDKTGDTTQDIDGADDELGNAGNADEQVDFAATDDDFEDDEVFQLLIVATSSEDASQSDVTISQLGKLVSAKVDLVNGVTAFTDPVATFVTGFNDDGSDNAHENAGGATDANFADDTVIIAYGNEADDANFDETGTDTPAPVTGNGGTNDDAAVSVGQTITIPLSFANEGSNIDSYNLSVESDDANLSIVFKDAAGNVITSTPAQAPDEIFNYTAEVTVTGETTAGLKNIKFGIESPTTGASDTVTDTIQVAISCDVEVSAASLQQVQPGGNIDYVHTIYNSSNAVVTFTLTQPTAPTGWTGVMSAQSIIDAANDGVGGADDIAAGDTFPSGQTVILPIDGSVTFIHRVFAPANAADAQTEVLEVNVAANSGCGTTVVQDVASVIVGQVRLTKAVTLDDECDCDSSNDPAFAVSGGQVQPGACAIWELTAVNEGDEDATAVVINDSLTEFTQFVAPTAYAGALSGVAGYSTDSALPGVAGTGVANSLYACKDVGCTLLPVDITGTLPATVDDVTVNVTTDGVVNFTAGTLTPGNSATAQFCVQVQ